MEMPFLAQWFKIFDKTNLFVMTFSVVVLSLFLEQALPSVVSYWTEGNCKKDDNMNLQCSLMALAPTSLL